ncbi:MAG TPA: patatin family protein [Syntrophales bacterium]|nr:patatin family protein [Syntrophales bacterium]
MTSEDHGNDEAQSMRTALVIEGGAMRGVFSTGLLDCFLEAGFDPFDFYVGVSSGASNLAAFLAEMPGRNKKIYVDYSLRPEFIDAFRFLSGGHLMDLDWLWNTTIREIRLDLKKIYEKGKPFLVVLTDVQSGDAVYKETSANDLEHLLKASSALPLLYRACPLLDGRQMTDGGVTDAIPVGKAIALGAKRIMVVRSRRHGYLKHKDPLDFFIRWHMRRYPALVKVMAGRVTRYNESIRLIANPPGGVVVVEVSPPNDFHVSRLCRDKTILEEGYDQGRSAAADAIERWKSA